MRALHIIGMALLLGWGLPGFAASTLQVFIWSEYLDPDVVKEFERQNDCRVVIDVYEDAESMLAKLQAAGGGGYDIVVPPDHVVPTLIKLGLLTRLRHDRLPNLKNLEARFLSPPFDPGNVYTVAYQWGTVGIYYRHAEGRAVPSSWAAFFDPARQPGAIVLIDSMRDAIGAALKHRGHGLNSTDVPALKDARDLLVDAKRRSVAMEGSVGGRNRVLDRTAAAAIVYSGEAVRGMSQDPETRYVIPSDGSQIWLDSLAIPTGAPHRDLAERFIDFLLDGRIGARISNYTRFATPNRAAREHLRVEDRENPAIYPPAEVMAKLEFLEDLGAKTRLYDQVWTQVKAR